MQPLFAKPESTTITFEVGSLVTTTTTQGITLNIKILAAEPIVTESGYESVLYSLAYQDEHQQWQPLCKPTQDGDLRALALPGQWNAIGDYVDNEEITFACTSGVIGKCALWGYHPQQTEQGYSLQPFHQACTRMARADYCGDGVSHTQNGTAIDIYDRLSIQLATADSGMAFEAAWGTEGAVTIHRTRWPESMDYVQTHCPERIQSLPLENTSSQRIDALIFNDSFEQPQFP
ncbi:MAG: ADYC domain-containing protein [Cyanobacteria bacterium P01_H01_bin.21]